MAQRKIGIQELITAVVAELRDRPRDREAMFFVEKLELEISFTVERTTGGGLDLQVVKAGHDRKTADVQTIRLSMLPLAAKGEKTGAGWDPEGIEDVEEE